MLGERMRLERVTVRGRREDNCWGPRGINAPRSKIVTVIFSKFRTFENNLETSNL
jgi:hypothetical protein